MRIGDWSSDVCSSDLFSSGARSIWSYAVNFAPPASASTFVIAAVRDVLPWSTWPIVPMLQCGFVRSNFAFAMTRTLLDVSQGTRSRGERPPRPGLTLDLACPTFRAGSASRSTGAGDGNRTRTTSLEGFGPTIELHPRTRRQIGGGDRESAG